MKNETTLTGPYGRYGHGAVGAVLNAACEIEGVPLTSVERFQVGDGVIREGDRRIASYKWFDDIDTPLFRWEVQEYGVFNNHSLMLDRDTKKVKATFRLHLGVGGMPCLEIHGNMATPTLHRFLMGMMTNLMADPRYRLHKDAGTFFQGGSDRPDDEWFLIEFWKPSGAKAFVDYVNAHYDPSGMVDE